MKTGYEDLIGRRTVSASKRRGQDLVSILGLAFVISYAPTSAVAQSTQGASPALVDGQIEEITITAQKRSENLREVPISAIVTTGEALQDHGVATLQGMTENMPAVHISAGGVSDRLFIRGIGSGDNAAFDQSVGTFVDDIYHGRAKLSQGSFLDVERIEVLKGTQSVYFGNSAIAGAINIATKKPGPSQDGYIRGSYSPQDKGWTLEGAGNATITDNLWVRAALLHTDSEGWLNDTGAGRKVPGIKNTVGRVTAVWEPTDAFSATVKAEASEQTQVGAVLYQLAGCPPSAGFPGPGRFCQIALASGQNTQLGDTRAESPGQGISLRTKELVATLNYKVAGTTLTSVTGYTGYSFDEKLDLDGTPGQVLNGTIPERYRQFSQEFRITSPKGKTFEYIAGVYYQRSHLTPTENVEYFFLTPTISSLPPFASLVPYLPLGQSAAYTMAVTDVSAFGAVTWNITPSLRTTVGLRQSKVDNDFSQTLSFGTAQYPFGSVIPFPPSVSSTGAALGSALKLGGVGTTALSRSDKHSSPSVNMQYDVTDRSMAYVSFANGFKAGGFNGIEFSGVSDRYAFSPETVNAYELGFKSRLFDKKVTLNVDLFRSEYSALQAGVKQFNGTLPVNLIKNVGGSVSQGLEAELRWAINSHWTTGLDFTALDAKYTDYKNAGPTPLQAIQGLTIVDLTGKSLPFAPKFSGIWDLQYKTLVLNDLVLRVDANVFISTKVNLSPNNDPNMEQSGYAKLNGTITLTDPRTHWEYFLIGRNLTNRQIMNFTTDTPSTPGSYLIGLEQPRSFTIGAKYMF